MSGPAAAMTQGPDPCEQLISTETGTSFISGATFTNKPVTFSVVGDNAVFEGDIVLGTTAEMEETRNKVESGIVDFGIGITGEQFRWKDCLVPVSIDPNLPDQGRVIGAIQHWEDRTPMILPPRTTEPNFVRYAPGSGCSSQVGMRGGQQGVTLGSGCSLGNAIHETGHTIGLWHEQSREDRNNFITVVTSNIQPAALHNFDQQITDGDDIGAYDYGSIMHYPAFAFAIDATKPTIVTKGGQAIGQRDGLSTGDVDTVRNLYSKKLNILVHLQSIGDVANGQAGIFAGTRGQARRLEGFQISLGQAIPGLSMRYMAHLEGIGDTAFVNEGQFCGTRGQSRRLEGFAIQLTGAAAANFDVYYMAHEADIGDTGVFSNGEFCGTRGQSRRIEGMAVWLLQKFEGNLRGLVHLQGIGDVVQGRMKFAGTRGQGRRLEGFQLNFDPAVPGLSMQYMAHLQNIGDTSFVNEGQFVGTRGQSRRLEGFAVRLTGPSAGSFNVNYMAHLEGTGDTGVVSNGAFCGTRGQSRRVEGMRVWVKKK